MGDRERALQPVAESSGAEVMTESDTDASRTRFTGRGSIPEYNDSSHPHALSASDQAYGSLVGEGVSPALAEARREIEALLHGSPKAVTVEAEDHIAALLHKAGKGGRNEIGVMRNLLRSYSNLHCLRNDHEPTFNQDSAEFQRWTKAAKAWGILSGAGASESQARSKGWQKEYAPKKPAEVVAANRERNAQAGDVFSHAEHVLGEAQRLRDWVDRKNGSIHVTFTSEVERCIGQLANTGGQLGGLAAPLWEALQLPDTDAEKRDKVIAAMGPVESSLKSLRPKGGDAAETQDADRESGFGFVDNAASIVSVVPGIGKPLSVALTATSETFRYISGDHSATEAIARTIFSAVSAKYGEAIVGKGSIASQALRQFGYKAITGLTANIIHILYDPKLSPEEKEERINGAIAHALAEAVIDSIGAILKGSIHLSSPEEAREAYVLLGEVAYKLGVETQARPYLEKLKELAKEG